ncbi:MAG: DMT family transporter [Pseudomonadota bacterium]|jgi:drug/metabolite transporter (DMT)-like permease|nr:DMT family transporter [Alphaproteobacteria bacterium]
MQNKHKGLLWILGWCVTFTCGVTISKFLSTSTSNFSLFCIRYFCGLLFFLPIFIPQVTTLAKVKSNPWLHVIRALCIGASTLLTYQSYRNLPLAIATSVGFTGPLLASSFGMIFLKEKINHFKITALIAGYLGVLFIVQPHNTDLNLYYVFIGINACILAGFANTLARKLSYMDPALAIMFSSSFILGLIASIGFFTADMPENCFDLFLLCLVGLCGSLSQFAYIKAVSFAEISFIAPFEYTRLLLAVPIGYVLFGESINIFQVFGMTLIIFGSLYLSRGKNY